MLGAELGGTIESKQSLGLPRLVHQIGDELRVRSCAEPLSKGLCKRLLSRNRANWHVQNRTVSGLSAIRQILVFPSPKRVSGQPNRQQRV
jgi:hypothetical protein